MKGIAAVLFAFSLTALFWILMAGFEMGAMSGANYLSSPNATGAPPPADVRMTQSANKAFVGSDDAQPFSIFLPVIKLPVPSFANWNFETMTATSWIEVLPCCGYSLIKTVPITSSGISLTAHSGTHVAWLGGFPNVKTSISQTIFISTTYPTLRLNFWYWLASEELNNGCDNDTASIDVITSGMTKTLKAYQLCISKNTSAWQQDFVEVNDYAGQTVTFVFVASLNGSRNSNFFLDDISLMVP